MTYVALKPIRFSDTDTRMPGELVPEAHTWVNAHNWCRSGHVVLLVDGTEAEFVRLLREDRSAAHLAPQAPDQYLAGARMYLRHGAGAPTVPTSKTDAGAPAPEAQADDADDLGTDDAAPDAANKLANRLKSKRRTKG